MTFYHLMIALLILIAGDIDKEKVLAFYYQGYCRDKVYVIWVYDNDYRICSVLSNSNSFAVQCALYIL